jgi:hypothetical protein
LPVQLNIKRNSFKQEGLRFSVSTFWPFVPLEEDQIFLDLAALEAIGISNKMHPSSLKSVEFKIL